MTSSHLSQYVNRSARRFRDMTSAILRMSGADDVPRTPKLLFAFNSPEDIARTATGCDGDIGGLSTTHFELDTTHTVPTEDGGQRPTAKFWGDMRLRVKPGKEHIRPGYAGFRNRRQPTLFGDEMQDLSNHEYLSLRVRFAGDPRTKDSYYVNIQTDGPVQTDLWQHRLFLRKTDNSWEDVYIPISSFVLTNSGEISDHQIAMYREKIRSIGISILGGNSGVEGKYELGIDQMWAVNAEDVVVIADETVEKVLRDMPGL